MDYINILKNRILNNKGYNFSELIIASAILLCITVICINFSIKAVDKSLLFKDDCRIYRESVEAISKSISQEMSKKIVLNDNLTNIRIKIPSKIDILSFKDNVYGGYYNILDLNVDDFSFVNSVNSTIKFNHNSVLNNQNPEILGYVVMPECYLTFKKIYEHNNMFIEINQKGFNLVNGDMKGYFLIGDDLKYFTPKNSILKNESGIREFEEEKRTFVKYPFSESVSDIFKVKIGE